MADRISFQGYKYQYTDGHDRPVHRCPACGHDWLVAGGVQIVLTNGASEWTTESRLSPGGFLEDPHREVEHGYHSSTECGGCRETLMNLDDVWEGMEKVEPATEPTPGTGVTASTTPTTKGC